MRELRIKHGITLVLANPPPKKKTFPGKLQKSHLKKINKILCRNANEETKSGQKNNIKNHAVTQWSVYVKIVLNAIFTFVFSTTNCLREQCHVLNDELNSNQRGMLPHESQKESKVRDIHTHFLRHISTQTDGKILNNFA